MIKIQRTERNKEHTFKMWKDLFCHKCGKFCLKHKRSLVLFTIEKISLKQVTSYKMIEAIEKQDNVKELN